MAALAAAVFAASCGVEPESRELVVFAASSLRESIEDLGSRFEAEHSGVRVTCQFAGTPTLRAQIESGASADVFLAADAVHMDALASAGLVEGAAAFARNELMIAVSRDAAPRVRSAPDLRLAERIVIGAPSVPVGACTEQFLARAERIFGEGYRAEVMQHVVSREANVRLVLAKVTLGEADAAVVYRTDVLAAGDDVVGVEIPSDANVRAEYLVGILSASREPALAREFAALVRSAEGAASFSARGFLPLAPSESAR